MKLEEVLPYLRAGSVCIDRDGRRWRCYVNHELHYFNGTHWISGDQAPLDGWTLEVKPKVLWPERSIQWALQQAGEGGFVRRSSWTSRAKLSIKNVTGHWQGEWYDPLALDWEVVR